MATVRVMGVQMAVSPRLDDNLPKVLDYIRGSGCDFIVFPEMSLTGYHGKFNNRATRRAWRQIAEACRLAYVTALVGTGCKEDGETFIQTRIYTDEGELLGTHEKLVPTSTDREFCRPGEELRVFRHGSLTFGCLICNDLWVTPGCGPYPDPRLTYQLGKRGAQVIFHSIHSGSTRIHTPYHESNLALRALESKLYIVTANAADPKGPVNAVSGIVSPEGEWLTQCPREDEHTYTYDLEIEPA
ncbi:MAG TPA: carbon-nitrogen hydrolase family protein [Candidatus Hydrogenedentes bacterium]|nr:carbon-nitrogen hydrolase family protein [Candidatus Hydrogenedentota bacterium]HIJ73046.1 carbon-nitrogen hydrolase family protein [Candidatus Hydrogenedentota bacterium]